MIKNKSDLYEYIKYDNDFLVNDKTKGKIIRYIAKYPYDSMKQYLIYLRKQEYYINTAKNNKLHSLLGLWYERKKNKLGARLGIEIGPNSIGKGAQIWHANVVINPAVKIGENCALHGNNCIGNSGNSQAVPTIGNHVDIGFGSVIIGGITIADHVVIGANSVVTKSILEEGSVVVGIPGKVIKKVEIT